MTSSEPFWNGSMTPRACNTLTGHWTSGAPAHAARTLQSGFAGRACPYARPHYAYMRAYPLRVHPYVMRAYAHVMRVSSAHMTGADLVRTTRMPTHLRPRTRSLAVSLARL